MTMDMVGKDKRRAGRAMGRGGRRLRSRRHQVMARRTGQEAEKTSEFEEVVDKRADESKMSII